MLFLRAIRKLLVLLY